MKYIYIDENDKNKKPHYSPAVVQNKTVYVSGQLPIRKGDSKPPADNIEEQTTIVLDKLSQILSAAKSDINKVLRTTIYITDISYWDKVNEIYAEFFGKHRPARTIVPVKTLHFGCLIELDAIAYID